MKQIGNISFRLAFTVTILYVTYGELRVNDTSNLRVVRGQNADKGEYPWMARVYVKQPPQGDEQWWSLCGGSLVAFDMVLTARHCLDEGKRPYEITIILGDHKKGEDDGTEETRYGKALFTNSPTDVLLIRLDQPATPTRWVQTVGLGSVKPPRGASVVAIGWGRTASGSSSVFLQEVEIPIASDSACNRELMMNWQLGVKSHELCAGSSSGSYSNVCTGDSGGPLMYKAPGTDSFKVVGITSRGSSQLCPDHLHYAVFASVPYVYKWATDLLGVSAATTPSSSTTAPSTSTMVPSSATAAATASSVSCDNIDDSWIKINNDRPWRQGIDTETPKCPGGKSPLCVKCSVAGTNYCRKHSSSCVDDQKFSCTANGGLRCQNREQKVVIVKRKKRKRRKRCRCCDYALMVKCP